MEIASVLLLGVIIAAWAVSLIFVSIGSVRKNKGEIVFGVILNLSVIIMGGHMYGTGLYVNSEEPVAKVKEH